MWYSFYPSFFKQSQLIPVLLVVLGLHGDAGFSLGWSLSWGSAGSAVVVTGSGALPRVDPSRARDQTRVPGTGGRILKQWTPREVLSGCYFRLFCLPRMQLCPM